MIVDQIESACCTVGPWRTRIRNQVVVMNLFVCTRGYVCKSWRTYMIVWYYCCYYYYWYYEYSCLLMHTTERSGRHDLPTARYVRRVANAFLRNNYPSIIGYNITNQCWVNWLTVTACINCRLVKTVKFYSRALLRYGAGPRVVNVISIQVSVRRRQAYVRTQRDTSNVTRRMMAAKTGTRTSSTTTKW